MKSQGPLKPSCLQRGSSGCDKYKVLVGEFQFLFSIRPFHPRWLLVGSLSPSRAHSGEAAQNSSDDRDISGEEPGRDGNRGRGGSSVEGGQMKGFKRAEEPKM